MNLTRLDYFHEPLKATNNFFVRSKWRTFECPEIAELYMKEINNMNYMIKVEYLKCGIKHGF